MRFKDEDIRSLPLLVGLDRESCDRLLAAASVRRFSRERELFSDQHAPDFLHVLMSGTVELFKRAGERDYGLMLLSPGDVFMPAAVLFEEPYLNSARTLSTAHLLLVPAPAVREEFARTHRFAINMGRVLAGQFRMATRHVLDLRCRTAPQRLGDFLLKLVDEGGNGEIGDLPVSKKRLAARVGMTPETFSRMLQKLADNGLLVRGTKIYVHDRQRILTFCGPAPYSDHAELALDVHAM